MVNENNYNGNYLHLLAHRLVSCLHTLYLVLERTWLISKSLVKNLYFEGTGSGSYTH